MKLGNWLRQAFDWLTLGKPQTKYWLDGRYLMRKGKDGRPEVVSEIPRQLR